MIDLFGYEAPPPATTPAGKPKRKDPKPSGHAWTPGTGPDGETCKTCRHYTLRHFGGVYRKCGLMRAQWTRGCATDIRAGDLACLKWERKV